jgi:hypothetical protein
MFPAKSQLAILGKGCAAPIAPQESANLSRLSSKNGLNALICAESAGKAEKAFTAPKSH